MGALKKKKKNGCCKLVPITTFSIDIFTGDVTTKSVIFIPSLELWVPFFLLNPFITTYLYDLMKHWFILIKELFINYYTFIQVFDLLLLFQCFYNSY